MAEMPKDMKIPHTKADETPELFATFKQRAYDLGTSQGMPRGWAYEALANQYGYATWSELRAKWGR